jgi:adenine-specific DNA-methyltransferase
MTPYYEQDGITVLHGRCEAALATMPPASVDLIVTDPPYFRVKGDWWDRQWNDGDGFLAWLGGLAHEWRRVLKPNGSLYVFASPEMCWSVEGVIRSQFNVLNTVRWIKDEGWHNKSEKEALRSFLSPWEAVIFAEQQDNGRSPFAAHIQQMREQAGMTCNDVDLALGFIERNRPERGSRLSYRWETGSSIPTEDTYNRLCDLLQHPSNYEEVRRPFSLTDRGEWSDVWRFKTVPALESKHPCEKPVALAEHIIRASSRPGDLVLDCFAGSGTFLVAARNLGRRAIGIDATERWCERAMRRLQQSVLPLAV